MHKIQIDNFIFHVNVTEYSPAIPGTYDKNANSDYEYFGYPEQFDWECFEVFEQVGDEFLSVDCKNTIDIVDLFAEQITSKLLDKIHFEQECAEEYYA